jgi:uncharacterized membrane protein YhhN
VTTAAVVPFAALALVGLAAADGRSPRVYAVVKPLATAALVLVLEPHAGGMLRLGVGVGLALSTLGDALLVRKAERRFFYAGMACFAAAHLAYTATLLLAAPSGTAVGLLVGLALAGPLTAFLESRLLPRLPPGLGLPVGVYGAVLAGTVVAACAWGTSAAPFDARAAFLTGALLLYAGDAFYAFNLFVSRLRFGQGAGLVLYWSGQVALMLGARNA